MTITVDFLTINVRLHDIFCKKYLFSQKTGPTAVVADLSIVCAAEREVRGSIPVWEYVLQGPMSEFETR